MNRTIIFLLLILTILSCKEKSKGTEFNLSGKSFAIYSKENNGESIMDFQDSTYVYLGINSNHTIRRNPETWELTYYENIPFLTFQYNSLGIKKFNDTTYCLYPIGNLTDSIVMYLRKPKWNRDMLNGNWIERKYIATDKSNFTNSLARKSIEWPPFYQITDSTLLNTFIHPKITRIITNNTNEVMELGIDINYPELNWIIKNVNDSIMIIDRIVRSKDSSGLKWDKNIELIKKR